MKELSGKIGFVGAGNMASALISGLVNSNHNPKNIIASSPEEEHLLKLSSGLGIKTTQDNLSVVKTSDIVILAIKPNIIEDVLSEIKEEVKKKDILILSIAAGVKIAKIESILGNTTRIFRAMPNTPASIMMGVTVVSQLLVISFTTDWRFSPERSREIVDALIEAKKDVSYLEINSPHGHDSFLFADEQYVRGLASFLEN